jgi:hypothetical protein
MGPLSCAVCAMPSDPSPSPRRVERVTMNDLNTGEVRRSRRGITDYSGRRLHDNLDMDIQHFLGSARIAALMVKHSS